MSDDRAVRAVTDVLAVTEAAPGLARVVTWSDEYYVDARGDGCNCPDVQHNLGPGEWCKHEYAALLADIDTPDPFIREIEPSQVCKDCAELPEGWACSDCAINGDAKVTGDPCA